MKYFFYAVAIYMFFPALSQATILDGEILRQTGHGQFVKLDPDTAFSVGNDTFDTDHLYGFDEDQNITLDAPIRVDIGGAGGMICLLYTSPSPRDA